MRAGRKLKTYYAESTCKESHAEMFELERGRGAHTHGTRVVPSFARISGGTGEGTKGDRLSRTAAINAAASKRGGAD